MIELMFLVAERRVLLLLLGEIQHSQGMVAEGGSRDLKRENCAGLLAQSIEVNSF